MLTGVKFLTELDLTPVIGSDANWKLVSDFHCLLSFDNKPDKLVIVPTGFITDLATTPWFVRLSFPQADGKWDDAAAMHDYLYSGYGYTTRKEADDAFYFGVLAGGGKKLTAWLMWAAVRVFARSHWEAP